MSELKREVWKGKAYSVVRDNGSKRQAYGKFRFLARAFPNKPLEIWRSSSGKGFHLILRGLDWEFGSLLKARLMLGDDPRRVAIDIKRKKAGMATGVMFHKKAWKTSKLLGRING